MQSIHPPLGRGSHVTTSPPPALAAGTRKGSATRLAPINCSAQPSAPRQTVRGAPESCRRTHAARASHPTAAHRGLRRAARVHPTRPGWSNTRRLNKRAGGGAASSGCVAALSGPAVYQNPAAARVLAHNPRAVTRAGYQAVKRGKRLPELPPCCRVGGHTRLGACPCKPETALCVRRMNRARGATCNRPETGQGHRAPGQEVSSGEEGAGRKRWPRGQGKRGAEGRDGKPVG